jgi:rfaE bifunctional protein nucleotidyltransferase chain/domain
VAPAALARALAARWHAAAVCVTRGAAGATLADAAGHAEDFPAARVSGDPCGAGDRFAAAAARALAAGATPAEATRAAVSAASSYVASSGARTTSVPAPIPPARPSSAPRREAHEVVERVRGAGGTVVATGGCFDLLHVGHVRSLEAARGFGDCLVVLLNGDSSVRGLKGDDRPLVGEEERAETLRALACVDAVTIFDEPDPTEALRRLQPDVWCKGGDYLLDELPEAKAIAT